MIGKMRPYSKQRLFATSTFFLSSLFYLLNISTVSSFLSPPIKHTPFLSKTILSSSPDDDNDRENVVIPSSPNNDDSFNNNDNDIPKEKTNNPPHIEQNDTININENDSPSSPNNSSSSSSNETVIPSKENNPPPIIEKPTTIIGIGGKDGFIYDINKVKRNFIQETIKKYKEELLELLITPQHQISNDGLDWMKEEGGSLDDLIEMKLAALVEVNPVSTTTDSNLLDGQWEFVYASDDARRALSRTTTTPSPSPPPPADTIKTNGGGGFNGTPWKLHYGKTDTDTHIHPSTRYINLENLNDDQNPYVIDQTKLWNGVLTLETSYEVQKLTRTTLQLKQRHSKLLMGGKQPKVMRNLKAMTTTIEDAKEDEFEVQIKYLDSDLCISTTGEGMNGPLLVYTKNDRWRESKERSKRKRRLPITILSKLQSPLQVRKRLLLFLFRRKQPSPPPKNKKSILVHKVLKLGEIDNVEEESWDEEDDPFAHLDLEERRRVMMGMSLKEIESAGRYQKQMSELRREQRKKERMGRKKLKKPEKEK